MKTDVIKAKLDKNKLDQKALEQVEIMVRTQPNEFINSLRQNVYNKFVEGVSTGRMMWTSTKELTFENLMVSILYSRFQDTGYRRYTIEKHGNKTDLIVDRLIDKKDRIEEY